MSISKNKNWPLFSWSAENLLPLLLEIRRKQGELTARRFPVHENRFQAVTSNHLIQMKAHTSLPASAYRNFEFTTAPHPEYLIAEINRFLRWFNSEDIKIDGLIRAATAFLWFVAIHPFDDGNQRVASVISERALQQDEKINFKRNSVADLILNDKRSYDHILQQTLKSSDLEITPWLQWYLNLYLQALVKNDRSLAQNLRNEDYWSRWKDHSLNERQRRVLKAMLEFDEDEIRDITNRKYVALTETSPESAKRDLADLSEKNILTRNPGSGRSTSYSLK